MPSQRWHITQGEWAVGKDPEQVISTILGSCVSCCLWDPLAGVGGMNHMLLTITNADSGTCNLTGINAMELLINDILKLGGKRERLCAKAFGGARMVAGLSEIGRLNRDFTMDYLQKEGIPCESRSLGGVSARHLMFWPATGRVVQKISSEMPVETRAEIQRPPAAGNDLELF